ncbi:MAG: GTPase HflX [Bacilli bacterium]|nr:GTPase HflX [Bacilli bacterium]
MNENKEKVYMLSLGSALDPYVEHFCNEYKMLLKEIGYEVEHIFYQNIDSVNRATFVGKGKLAAIRDYFHDNKENGVKKLACAFEITAVQKKNMESITGLTVFDRTQVILDIFDNNAKTREAKLQVEIAKLNYSKAHLINEKANYSQVTSGGGHNKGEGETELELKRRRIAAAIYQKKKELEEIKFSRSNSRNARRDSIIPKISIVGYTNAGKSTLMNKLLNASKAQEKKTVLQKDALFATLETSTRLISIHEYPEFILTDTVGFISELPHYLIDAFRSTLEEITEADLLIQVVDSHSPFLNDEVRTTNEVLASLGCDTKKMIYLYNKYDLLKSGGFTTLPKKNERYVSLQNDDDIETIVSFISASMSVDWKEYNLMLPYSIDINGFKKENYCFRIEEKENGHCVVAKLNPKTEYKYKDYLM